MKKLALLILELTAGFVLLMGCAVGVGHVFPGDMLAYVSGNIEYLGLMDMQVLDLRTRKSISMGKLTGVSSLQFTWSRDGRLAFATYRDGNDEIYVWDGAKST